MTPEQEDLREAIRHGQAALEHSRAEWNGQRYNGTVLMDANALRDLMTCAHQAMPKTKMVEVWRVEYARRFIGGWIPLQQTGREERKIIEEAEGMRAEPMNYSCIRVTGPHQQEVPCE